VSRHGKDLADRFIFKGPLPPSGRVLVVDGEEATVPWVIPPIEELLGRGCEDPKKQFAEDLVKQRQIYLDPHA